MNDLFKYLEIMKRRWLPASLVLGTVFLLSFLRAAKEMPLYQAKGQLLIKTRPVGYDSQWNIVSTVNLPNELVIIHSNAIGDRVRKALKIEESQEDLSDPLQVNNITGTDILEFSYTSPNPERAAKIINAWMQAYIQSDREKINAETVALKNFIQQQIPKQSSSLRLAAEKLKAFKQENRVLDITAEAASTVEIINKLDGQIAENRTELAVQNSRLQSLQKIFGVPSEEALIGSFVNESSLGKSLLEKLQEVKLKLAEEKLRFHDTYPGVIYLREQEAMLRKQLQDHLKTIFVGDSSNLLQLPSVDEIVQPGAAQQSLLEEYSTTESLVKSLQVRIQSLQKQIDTYRRRVDLLPELEFQQRQLQLDLSSKEESFQNLLKKYQETLLSINEKQGNIQLIEPATVPTFPLNSRRPLYLFQGLLGGLILAWITAMLLEKLDRTIKTPEAVKELLGYDLIGRISNFAEGKKKMQVSPVPVRDQPYSPVSEAFRILHTNLRFINSQKPLQALVISSSVSAEGKSTIAANLAAVAAESGRKVLLIDSDLRKPSQHRIWSVNHQGGVGAVLDGHSDVEELIEQVMPNLDILVAGEVEANPVVLLGSSKMTALLQYARKKYDLIILDSPPLKIAADASILGNIADAILMVVRPGKVSYADLNISKELLEQSGQRVLGLVCNFSSSKDSYVYSQNYYNYYGYGNGKLSQEKVKGNIHENIYS